MAVKDVSSRPLVQLMEIINVFPGRFGEIIFEENIAKKLIIFQSETIVSLFYVSKFIIIIIRRFISMKIFIRKNFFFIHSK